MKFDNYMDPRKTFGKAVTQEAEKSEDICDSVKKTGRVMTIEEHYIKGGLGTIVMETLNDNGINVPIKMHGIPHCYASNGPYNELMAYYKLDADGVYGGIKEFLKNEEGNK